MKFKQHTTWERERERNEKHNTVQMMRKKKRKEI